VNVLIWHVHGSWMTAFVSGRHRYLVPVDPQRSAWGRGRALTWTWPDAVVELTEPDAVHADVDVVVLQRPEELDMATRWLGGRRPGVDVPALYVEHNAPQGRVNEMIHPMAGTPGLTIVHVTAFNDLFWDCTGTPTVVIEHGIVDPGYRYTGEHQRIAVVINEPVRRHRVTGTDLLPRFSAAGPVDLFGLGAEELGGVAGLSQDCLHTAMGERRLYLHPFRWTSLGLSLLEAMHLGLPIVALATTEVVEAVPPDAGALSTSVDVLVEAARRLLVDPDAAREAGRVARSEALRRYGLQRFLDDWDDVITEVTR
jgi:hypothetical protein